MKPIQISVSRLSANPFRNMDEYPIDGEKISMLRESMRTTGIWPNIEVRSNGSGYEIAYGHHRLQAIREEFGPKAKAWVIEGKFSDREMAQKMGRENMEEWGASIFACDMETVAAVVRAYAAGKIELEKPQEKATKSGLRYAPSFVKGDVPDELPEHPYATEAVADFLGWGGEGGMKKVAECLGALELIELGAMARSTLMKLRRSEAVAVIRYAREQLRIAELERRERQRLVDEAAELGRKPKGPAVPTEAEIKRKARDGAKVMASELRAGATVQAAKKAADEKYPKMTVVQKRPPNVSKGIDRVLAALATAIPGELEDLIKIRREELDGKLQTDVSERDWKNVAKSLRSLARRANNAAQKLERS